MLTSVFFDILEINIAVSVVVLLAAFLMPKLKKYRVGWRKWFWLMLGIRLLIPYNFTWDSYAVRLISFSGEWQIKEAVKVSTAVLLCLVWFSGLVICLRHRYLCYRKFLKEIVENSRESFEERELTILREVLKEIGVGKEVTLYHCPLIASPMVIEVLQPMLLLPEEEYSDEQLRMIFRHEGMHIDNFDIVYKSIMLLAEAVHWFNPVVHKMVNWSYRDVEIFCDECVVEDMDKKERGNYGRTILDAVEKQKGLDIVFSTCFYGSQGLMKQRVENLFNMEGKKNGVVLLCVFCGFLLILGMFIKCGI